MSVRRRGVDPAPIRQRFDAKWRQDVGVGCWEWTASTRKHGYGQFMVGSKADGTHRPIGAHRAAFEIYRGPIPAGLVLDHLCRNPRCVNPWHLEPVTHEENMRRGVIFEVARARAERTHCANGHLFSQENTRIRTDRPGARRCMACKRAVNVAYRERKNVKGTNHDAA